MKKIILISYLLAVVATSIYAQQSDFQNLNGPNIDQMSTSFASKKVRGISINKKFGKLIKQGTKILEDRVNLGLEIKVFFIYGISIRSLVTSLMQMERYSRNLPMKVRTRKYQCI
jgi:hypothetical protein